MSVHITASESEWARILERIDTSHAEPGDGTFEGAVLEQQEQEK